jgi:hypothetical protein
LTSIGFVRYNRRDFATKQTLTKLHLIAVGHKKDLTIDFARAIIGAANTKHRFVTFALAPARRKKDYDFFHKFGHKFPAKMQIEC